jgi:hypothetical protein
MDNKVVFIIGAGASKEAGLPTGVELKQKISNMLDIRFDHYDQKSGDYSITQALRNLVQTEDGQRGDINPYIHQAWHIRDALPMAISIDNFIDSQRENEEIKLLGKLAIIKSILEAEQTSKLSFEKNRVDSSIDLNALVETWYLPFFQLVTESCELKDLEERFQSIVLIIFNYDRCIEHFLIHALQKYYKISETDAAKLISSINIYHPYGSVGNLPWATGGNPIEFGQEPSPQQLIQLTEIIKTFTEGTDPESSEIIAIKEHVLNASKAIFMGFAFHKLNMTLITPNDIQPRPSGFKCFASAYGISESDKEAIKIQINELYAHNVETSIEQLPCFKLFNEYWRSLAF